MAEHRRGRKSWAPPERTDKTRRTRTAPGAPPGTLVIDPQAPRPRVRVIAYGPEKLSESEVEQVSDIRAMLGQWPVVWVNVDGLGSAETIRELAGIFDLHRLAVEDVVNVNQRAKAELYGNQLFLVTHMLSLNEYLETEQISLFLGDGFVITFQEHQGDCLDPVRDRIRRGVGRIRAAGADYLAYSLLDAVTDHFFPVLEKFGERLEELEMQVVEQPEPALVGDIHAVKRELLTLRRLAWPQRDAISWLLRDEVPLITKETELYFRDCYDNVTRTIDMIEIFRELTSDLMGAYMSALSNNMNAVMKVLTIIATIFIPLTFIAGIYGMNFEYMPETKLWWGYFASLGAMAIVAGLMLVYFRRKNWI